MADNSEGFMAWGERVLRSEARTPLADLAKAAASRLKTLVLPAAGIAAAIVVVPMCYVNINAGSGGVAWHRFSDGTVHGPAVSEGLHLKWPWNRIQIFDLKMQDLNTIYECISNDGLVVKVTASLRYDVSPDKLSHLYQDIGTNYEKILVGPSLGSIVREIVSRYRADELYSFARHRFEREVLEAVSDRLEYGRGNGVPAGAPDKKDGYIHIENLAVLDIVLPPTVLAAIENKMQQDQVAQEYEFRLKREAMEVQRKELEVQGVENYKRVAEAPWFKDYMKLIEIQSNYRIAESPNSKIIFMGNSGQHAPGMQLSLPAAP
jgi:regulator of protease activity HflC (stomatin/prohibitin superfamily)